MRRIRTTFAFVGLLVGACAGGGGGGAAAGAASPGGVAGGAVGGAEPLPLILVHGFGGEPANWHPVAGRIARGRPLLPEVYAGDTDAWAAGSLARDSVICFGYYREAAGAPRFYTDRLPALGSIGGCPAPRTDPHAPAYTISYVDQLDRAVENVCRAAGVERVDVVGYSMGGVVSRAYVRWRSLRGVDGRSRVRRLLTVGTPNHGVNSLEATMIALTLNGARDYVDQGEVAELNRECAYWDGRSFIDRLNDGWGAFCRAAGVAHGNLYAYGHAPLQPLLPLQQAMSWLNGPVTQSLLVHPTPGYDYATELAEASGDGDGVVRVDSAHMDPAAYPGVLFSAGFFGRHGDDAEPERDLHKCALTEAAIRRFVLEARLAGPPVLRAATLTAVTAGGEASWLRLSVDADDVLAAQVLLEPRGVLGTIAGALTGGGERIYSGLVHPGAQAILVDPDRSDGRQEATVRLYGLGGEVDLPAAALQLDRSGRPAAPSPTSTLGAPTVTQGVVRVPLVPPPGAPRIEACWALDAGPWSAWTAGPDLAIPSPGPGRYELKVRLKTDANAAGLSVEAAAPIGARLTIDAAGGVTLSP